METGPLKPLRWVGASLQDLKAFPLEVRSGVGYALYAAQKGDIDSAAKPMKGFGGASVVEIVAPFAGDAWRAVYTVRFPGAVYVLHAFQKKRPPSPKAAATFLPILDCPTRTGS